MENLKITENVVHLIKTFDLSENNNDNGGFISIHYTGESRVIKKLELSSYNKIERETVHMYINRFVFSQLVEKKNVS